MSGKLGDCSGCGKVIGWGQGHYYIPFFILCHKCSPKARLELVITEDGKDRRIVVKDWRNHEEKERGQGRA